MGVFTKTLSTPTPADAPRALTAATQRLRIDDRQAMDKLRVSTEDRSWQNRAWQSYESIGEIHFAFNLVANLISRIRFFAAADAAPNSPPSYVQDSTDLTPGLANAADAAVRRLGAGQGEMGAIARSLALNLSIPGECYLVQMPGTTQMTPEGVTTTPPRWEIRSTDEVVVSQDPKAPVRIRSHASANLNEHIVLPPRAFIGRVWRRHPRWSNQADSSLRSVLDLADELLLLNQTFKATARSRLNSGVLFVPDGLSASSPTTADPAAHRHRARVRRGRVRERADRRDDDPDPGPLRRQRGRADPGARPRRAR